MNIRSALAVAAMAAIASAPSVGSAVAAPLPGGDGPHPRPPHCRPHYPHHALLPGGLDGHRPSDWCHKHPMCPPKHHGDRGLLPGGEDGRHHRCPTPPPVKPTPPVKPVPPGKPVPAHHRGAAPAMAAGVVPPKGGVAAGGGGMALAAQQDDSGSGLLLPIGLTAGAGALVGGAVVLIRRRSGVKH